MSPSSVFFLLILGSIVDTKTLTEKGSLLYPYGPQQGDETNPKLDDGTSEAIALSVPFTFYGKTYKTVFVNNNGVISFNEPVREYTPNPFPLADGSPFVAPYWADVDNVLGGDIFYRQTSDPALLKSISQDISQYFPKSPFTASWALVVTWDHVAYYGSTSEKGNTFQAVLTTDSKMFYIILNYWDIQWTTGTAGFNSGDDTNFYNIPGSQTDAIINITTTSNVKVPGRWVFRVDNFQVTGVDPPQLNNNCWL